MKEKTQLILLTVWTFIIGLFCLISCLHSFINDNFSWFALITSIFYLCAALFLFVTYLDFDKYNDTTRST